MSVTWTKTKFLGVRYREHATRKHGRTRADRCFSIRYKKDGKDKEEVVGWASEGVTAEKAFKTLSLIRENIRLGVEPSSIAAMRLNNQQRRAEEEERKIQKKKETMTFSHFWSSEYLPLAEATKTRRTVASEKWLYSHWIRPALGDLPLQRIDPAKVEAVLVHAQKAGKSAATARYILAVISQIWNKAAERGIVQGECPVRRVKKPRADNRRMRFLSKDEARALLDALKERSQDAHDTALVSLFCGLRAGEIHALTWGDISMEEGTISVKDPKNRRNRHAYMSQEVRAALESRMKGQASTEYVFPGAGGARKQWISATFSRTVDALGLNNSGDFQVGGNGKKVPAKITDPRNRVVFHSLRHTFASWLVQEGNPLYTVAKLMGHSTLEMTQRYAHLAPDSLRKAALSLEGRLNSTAATVLPFPKKHYLDIDTSKVTS